MRLWSFHTTRNVVRLCLPVFSVPETLKNIPALLNTQFAALLSALAVMEDKLLFTDDLTVSPLVLHSRLPCFFSRWIIWRCCSLSKWWTRFSQLMRRNWHWRSNIQSTIISICKMNNYIHSELDRYWDNFTAHTKISIKN